MKKILFISFLFLSGIFTANAQWQQVLNEGEIISIFPYRSNLLCGTSKGIYLSADSGKTWIATDTASAANWIEQFAAKDSLLFASTLYAIYVSTDSGKSWKSVSTLPQGTQIKCFTFSGNNLLVTNDNGIGLYISMDYGKSWVATDTTGLNLNSLYAASNELFPFINMGDETVLMLGNYSYITNNHGLTWRLKGYGFHQSLASIVLGNYIYVAINNNILRTNDTGITWQYVFSGNSGPTMNGLCTDNHYILASDMNLGIVFSKDSGNTWAIINNGLPNNGVFRVAILGDYIFCGTYPNPNYLYRMPLTEAIVVPDTIKYITGIQTLPSGFPSLDIYPDPVKHSATVDFGQTLQNGSLQIFNALGQRVQQIDQISEAKIILQPNNLPAGAYTYILTEQGKATAAGKLIIIQ